MSLELLKSFENEINKEWTSVYSAKLDGNILTVFCECYDKDNILSKVEAGWVNDNLDFGGADDDVINQLLYMITR